jgi:hypothetical protein
MVGISYRNETFTGVVRKRMPNNESKKEKQE